MPGRYTFYTADNENIKQIVLYQRKKMNCTQKIRFIIIVFLWLSAPLLAWAETDGSHNIILENEAVDPRYFTLENQQDGTDILKEGNVTLNLAHLRLFEHIIEALDVIYDEHRKDLEGLKFGSIVVVYEYPDNLEFNFLSENNKITKNITYKEPESDLAIRSALIIFDFLEVDGKIETNLVSFVQLSSESLSLEDEVVFEYDIERGSWVVKATGYVTKTSFFVTAKTKVQLSTRVAKKHIARKVAKEYMKELKKLGAEEIIVEQKQAPPA